MAAVCDGSEPLPTLSLQGQIVADSWRGGQAGRALEMSFVIRGGVPDRGLCSHYGPERRSLPQNVIRSLLPTLSGEWICCVDVTAIPAVENSARAFIAKRHMRNRPELLQSLRVFRYSCGPEPQNWDPDPNFLMD